MTVSAHDIAAEIRRRLPGVGTKKLHKLLYLAQGHHLAVFGRPLFSESVRAFEMGPVVKSLWQDEDRDEPAPEPHELGEGELNTIGYTISRYGNLSGNDLERLSHAQPPWQAGWASRNSGGSDLIPNEIIGGFFRSEIDKEDAELGVPRDVITRWLASIEPPDPANPGQPDRIEDLLARLNVG
jgi:uncharacterized phage-associated protein